MLTPNNVVLCRYQYDPMDRIAGRSPAGADSVRQFYQKSRLATEMHGQSRRALFKVDDQLLAQQVLENTSSSTALLATDQQRSVLHQTAGAQQTARAYTAYGFSPAHFNVPGFNGEQPDPVTGHYLLGNGYRAFNPVLMRFNSPDNLSPFGEGGLNAYAYCGGDPVNHTDPTGHLPNFLKPALRTLRIIKPSRNISRLTSGQLGAAPPAGSAAAHTMQATTEITPQLEMRTSSLTRVLSRSSETADDLPTIVKRSPKLLKEDQAFDRVNEAADTFRPVHDEVWAYTDRRLVPLQKRQQFMEAKKAYYDAIEKLPKPPSYKQAMKPPSYNSVMSAVRGS